MSVLLKSLEALPLPTRMLNVASRRGLTTVGDLARLHPASLLLEKSLGKKTVSETREVLEHAIGMRWEDAAAVPEDDDDDEVRAVSTTLDPAALGWNGLAVVLPEPLRARAVVDAPLPARLVSYAVANGLATIGALVKVPASDLEAAPNLGRRTVKDAADMLLRLRAALAEQGPVLANDWRRLFVESLAKLPLRERMVLTQRAGLVGPPPKLSELGESFGVSRERVRQLEVNALGTLRRESVWTEPLVHAFGEICPPFAARLADVEVDGVPLVRSPELDADAFAVLLESVLEGRAGHVFEHDGTAYFGKTTADVFATKLARLEWVCESLVYPVDAAGIRDRVKRSADLSNDELVVLFELVRGGLREEAGRVVGYGADRAEAVRALLRAEGKPVAVAHVHARLGRSKLPDDVVWVDRGLVTMPELVPDFHLWRQRLGPLAATVIGEHGAERQWQTTELLPLLATMADLPEWMNPHALGSVLRDADGVTYLGRNVVALTAGGAGERAHIDETIEDELVKAGAPLAEAELLVRVRARRSVTDLAWHMMRVRAPFVTFENGTVGLFPRDVPGGEGAAKVLRDATAEWLEQRDEGAGVVDQRAFVVSLGAPISHYDPRLVRSLLRHDGRFRLAQGGGLGLAAWGETRTKTQKQALEELLAAGGGRVRVADAVGALPTANGEPMRRTTLGLLANQVGARLSGDFVERVEAAAATLEGATASDRVWLEQVPEKAVETFARFLSSSRDVAKLRTALVAWRGGMEKLVGYPVDRVQVHRVADAAARVLERAAERGVDEEWARAGRAAVEYLVCVEDGESDLIVGGLDDDEAVLTAVLG